MLFIIYQEDRDDGVAIRAANKDRHFAYLEQHRDILVLGGALLADDGVKRWEAASLSMCRAASTRRSSRATSRSAAPACSGA
jgi:uncharacterized protein YciI